MKFQGFVGLKKTEKHFHEETNVPYVQITINKCKKNNFKKIKPAIGLIKTSIRF